MKIKKISVIDQVVDEIKQTIINQELKAGDKLASETEMAELYGVNRLSVRMALQKLSTLGVIRTRAGDGSYVTDFSMYPVINEIVDFYMSEDKIAEVQQMRRLLELECVALAAKLSTDEEKKELKRCLDVYYEARALMMDKDEKALTEKTIEADFAFHSQIIRMSHNRLFEEVYYMVQKLIRAHISLLFTKRKELTRQMGSGSVDGHYFIYEGICQGDVEKAQKFMEEVLDIVPPTIQFD